MKSWLLVLKTLGVKTLSHLSVYVNDKEAKVKDKSNEVLKQTEKELINFVTA